MNKTNKNMNQMEKMRRISKKRMYNRNDINLYLN